MAGLCAGDRGVGVGDDREERSLMVTVQGVALGGRGGLRWRCGRVKDNAPIASEQFRARQSPQKVGAHWCGV